MQALTALRFPCAAMIVLVHANGYFDFVDFRARIQLTQGVSFFFVLSGFLLAFNYDRAERRPWRAFYVARIARIFPAHIAATALYFVLVDNAFGPPQGPLLRTAILGSNLLLLQSWIPLREFFWSYNAVAWSLSTEVAFYIFFPLLIARRDGTLPWRALAFTAMLAVACILIGWWMKLPLIDAWSPSLLGLILVDPLARVFEFVLGIFMCALFRRGWHRGPPRWFVVECIAIGVATATMMLCAEPRLAGLAPALGYYLVWAGSAGSFALVVLVFAGSDGPIARLLSTRPLVLLGEASFCLYLIHQPVLSFIASRKLVPNSSLLGLGAYFGTSIAIALALFAFIETPARRWIVERWSRGSTRGVAMG